MGAARRERHVYPCPAWPEMSWECLGGSCPPGKARPSLFSALPGLGWARSASVGAACRERHIRPCPLPCLARDGLPLFGTPAWSQCHSPAAASSYARALLQGSSQEQLDFLFIGLKVLKSTPFPTYTLLYDLQEFKAKTYPESQGSCCWHCREDPECARSDEMLGLGTVQTTQETSCSCSDASVKQTLRHTFLLRQLEKSSGQN